MKISDYNKVQVLMTKRSILIKQYEVVSDAGKNSGLGVTIQGAYQSDDFVDAVRPLVKQELRKRIESIEQELAELGVSSD